MLTKCNRLNAWQSDLKGRPDSAGPMGRWEDYLRLGRSASNAPKVRQFFQLVGRFVRAASAFRNRPLFPWGTVSGKHGKRFRRVECWASREVWYGVGPKHRLQVDRGMKVRSNFHIAFESNPSKATPLPRSRGFGEIAPHTHTHTRFTSVFKLFSFFSLPVVSLHFRTEDWRRKEKLEESAGPEHFLWPVFSLPSPVERTFRSGNGVQGLAVIVNGMQKEKSKSQEICG